MKQFDKRYKASFIFSLILHLAIVIILVGEFNHPIDPKKFKQATLNKPSKEDQIIHAVSLDMKQVERQMQQIKRTKQRKRQKEIARQRYLQKQAKLAAQRTAKEKAKLKSLQEDAAKLKKKYAKHAKDAKQELAKLKQDAERAKQDSEALEKLNKVQKQKLADMKKAEAAMAAKKKAYDEALKKKRAEDLAQQQRLENIKQSQLLHYQSLIVEEISHNWVVPRGVDRRLACKLQIKLGPNGEVLSVAVLRSSGNPILDRSAQSAVYKASPLPVPNDPDLFSNFKVFNLTVRPENVISSV